MCPPLCEYARSRDNVERVLNTLFTVLQCKGLVLTSRGHTFTSMRVALKHNEGIPTEAASGSSWADLDKLICCFV